MEKRKIIGLVCGLLATTLVCGGIAYISTNINKETNNVILKLEEKAINDNDVYLCALNSEYKFHFENINEKSIYNINITPYGRYEYKVNNKDGLTKNWANVYDKNLFVSSGVKNINNSFSIDLKSDNFAITKIKDIFTTIEDYEESSCFFYNNIIKDCSYYKVDVLLDNKLFKTFFLTETTEDIIPSDPIIIIDKDKVIF